MSSKTVPISCNLFIRKSLWSENLIITTPHKLFPLSNLYTNDYKQSNLKVPEKCLPFSHNQRDYLITIRESSPTIIFLYLVSPKGLKLLARLPAPPKSNLVLETVFPRKDLLVCSDRQKGIVFTIDIFKRKILAQTQVEKINKIDLLSQKYIICHTGIEAGDIIPGVPTVKGDQQLHIFSVTSTKKLIKRYTIPILYGLADLHYDNSKRALYIYSTRKKYSCSVDKINQLPHKDEENYLELWVLEPKNAKKIGFECY